MTVPPLPTAIETAPASRAHILIVEDDATNRIILARMLNELGHRHTSAENGREALAAVHLNQFDLVLLDILMPELDGYEVLRQMKSEISLRHIPVIVISTVDSIESIARCIQMGAEDYLPKPFNQTLLKSRLDASLERKRLHDQERAYLLEIEAQHERAESLLRVILPEAIVGELKETHEVKPRRYDNVAVMFCDVVEFTDYCDHHEPEEVIQHLQQLVGAFEQLSLQYDLEEIKTIGDAFMTAAGLLKPLDNPVFNCVRCGLDMVALAPTMPGNWQVRVGVHVGPVIAGVLGHRKYLFDVWGDTVNTASRVEALGVPNAVNVSMAAWDRISTVTVAKSSSLVDVKGKGVLDLIQIGGLL